jgi:hypothetical protein
MPDFDTPAVSRLLQISDRSREVNRRVRVEFVPDFRCPAGVGSPYLAAGSGAGTRMRLDKR